MNFCSSAGSISSRLSSNEATITSHSQPDIRPTRIHPLPDRAASTRATSPRACPNTPKRGRTDDLCVTIQWAANFSSRFRRTLFSLKRSTCQRHPLGFRHVPPSNGQATIIMQARPDTQAVATAPSDVNCDAKSTESFPSFAKRHLSRILASCAFAEPLSMMAKQKACSPFQPAASTPSLLLKSKEILAPHRQRLAQMSLEPILRTACFG